MNNYDLRSLPLLAKTAYAIMCFERYVSAKYPDRNLRPVAEKMWHIVDGSANTDTAAYQFSEIIPEMLFEEASFEESGFRYLTKKQYAFYCRVLDKQDPRLNTLMNAVFSIAMQYAYTEVKPGSPETLPYLREVIEILEADDIAVPDPALLEQYAFAEINPVSFRTFNWNGEYVNPAGLSVLGITAGASTIEEASATVVTANGCEWVIEQEEDGVIITLCRNRSHLSDLVIPASLNGQPVTELDDNAFVFTPESGCQYVETLTVPDSVVRIGDNFFRECRRLRSVKMSANVQEIGNRAFAGTARLTHLTVGDSCRTIGSGFCADAAGIQEISLGAGIETIGDYACYGCPSMTAFRCDAEIIKLGYGSFWVNKWADTIVSDPHSETLFMGKDNCVLYRYCHKFPPARIFFDSSLRYVYDFAFGGDAWNCGNGVTDIYLPGAERIGVNAFRKVPNATVHLSGFLMYSNFGDSWKESVAALCKPANVVFDLP